MVVSFIFLVFCWANRIGLWSQVTWSCCLGPRWLSHQEGRINMEPPTTLRPATSRAAWTARPFLIRTTSWTSATWMCWGIGNLFLSVPIFGPIGEFPIYGFSIGSPATTGNSIFWFWEVPAEHIPRLPRAAKGLGGAKGKLLLERPLLFQFLAGVEGSALRSAAADALLWGGSVKVVNSTTKPTGPTDGREISPFIFIRFQPGFTTPGEVFHATTFPDPSAAGDLDDGTLLHARLGSLQPLGGPGFSPLAARLPQGLCWRYEGGQLAAGADLDGFARSCRGWMDRVGECFFVFFEKWWMTRHWRLTFLDIDKDRKKQRRLPSSNALFLVGASGYMLHMTWGSTVVCLQWG